MRFFAFGCAASPTNISSVAPIYAPAPSTTHLLEKTSLFLGEKMVDAGAPAWTCLIG